MKTLLLAGIATLFLATGAAQADTLPSKMLGRWCQMGAPEGRQVYERGPCSPNSARIDLKQNSYEGQSSEDGEGYGCDFKKIKRLPNGSYFIRAECGGEGILETEDMVFELVENQLEIIPTTIRFCVAPIEPPPEVVQDPEYNRDAWLALREGPGTRFKIIAKLGWDYLEADIVKGEWTHISNATNKTSAAEKKLAKDGSAASMSKSFVANGRMRRRLLNGYLNEHLCPHSRYRCAVPGNGGSEYNNLTDDQIVSSGKLSQQPLRFSLR